MTPTATAVRRTTAEILPSSPRYGEWLALFGSATVVLESPYPVVGKAPALGQTALFYKLDASMLKPERRERIVKYCARRFSLSPAEVEKVLADPKHGLPILLDDEVVLSDDLEAPAESVSGEQ